MSCASFESPLELPQRGPLESPQRGAPGSPSIGIVAALARELQPLRAHFERSEQRQGLEVLSGSLHGVSLCAAVCGVGKVRAARAATILIESGAVRALLMVGVCGGLWPTRRVGDLILAERAIQADFAPRDGREFPADSALLEHWSQVTDSQRGAFLTADRPAIRSWRRVGLARAYGRECVADMETAALAQVAQAAGVPWAGLRAVSDTLRPGAAARFEHNYPDQAGRAAESVPALVERLVQRG